MNADETDLKLKWPSTGILAGPSFSGKTSLIIELIKRRQEVFSKNVDRVIYLCKQGQKVLEDLQQQDKDVILIDNFDQLDNFMIENSLIIIDDFLLEVSGIYNQKVTEFFIRRSHHSQLSCWLLTQNPYGRNLRTISINATYFCFFKQPKDISTIFHIARQFCPHNINYLYESYRAATARANGYLFFDYHQSTSDQFRVRNCLFNEPYLEFYVENGKSKIKCSFSK